MGIGIGNGIGIGIGIGTTRFYMYAYYACCIYGRSIDHAGKNVLCSKTFYT